MANVISKSFTHTYAGQEATDVLYAPVFMGGTVEEHFTVNPNIKSKRNIYIAAALADIIKKRSGCGFSASGSLTLSDRTIDTVDLKVNLEQCFTEFEDTIFAEALKSGTAIEDMQDTDIADIFINALVPGMQRNLIKLAYFADAASGSGNYDHFDGLWAKWIDAVTAGDVTRVDTATYESSGVLTAGQADDLLQAMWEGQPNALKQVPAADKVFRVTGTIGDDYASVLENATSEFGMNSMVNGVELKYRGIPVVVQYDWDTAQDDTNCPNRTTIGDNFGVLTTRENLIFGTDIAQPTEDSNIMVWYDPKDEMTYTKCNFRGGVEYIHDDLQVVAY
tara:strand:- start:420 stop:1424 length:1005 start_codon:yes stop_codon:yes gene_type:complete